MFKEQQFKEKYTNLLSLKENLEAFYVCLEEIWMDSQGSDEDSLLRNLIIELNREAQIDFCVVFRQAILNSGRRVFDVIGMLKSALPLLDLNAVNLIHLFDEIYEKTKKDMAAHFQYEPLAELVTKQPLLCRELLDKLLVLDKDFVVGYISIFYQEFFKDNPVSIYEELYNLKDNENERVIIALISALSNLPYEQKEYKPFLDKTENVYEYVHNRELLNTKASLTRAYGRLIKHKPKLISKLFMYLELNTPEIDYEVSSLLHQNLDAFVNEPRFFALLMPLSRTKSEHKGILDNIDYVLSGLIKKFNKADLALEFFKEWIIESDYKVNSNKLKNIFYSTFYSFLEDKEGLQVLITNFLNHDCYKIHNAVSEIISYCLLEGLEGIRLDKKTLKNLNETDILYVVRKILGYITEVEAQCPLLFSVLDKSVRNKANQNIVYSVFTQHVAKEYPHSVIEFLEGERKNERSKIKIDLIDEIIESVKPFIENYKNLPRLKETIPPSQQSRRIMKEKSKMFRQSMEEAQENSAFRQLCQTVNLKNGNGFFRYIEGSYTSVSELNVHSTSIDMPLSLSTHAVKYNMKISGFRKAKRGQ